jgi:hypothetical protein
MSKEAMCKEDKPVSLLRTVRRQSLKSIVEYESPPPPPHSMHHGYTIRTAFCALITFWCHRRFVVLINPFSKAQIRTRITFISGTGYEGCHASALAQAEATPYPVGPAVRPPQSPLRPARGEAAGFPGRGRR